MANLNWKRDEVILALDLYVRSGASKGGPVPRQQSTEVQELSALLRRLSAYPLSDQPENHRSAHSVHLKLMNLRSVQTHGREGMPDYSRLDEAVWNEFDGAEDALAAEAAALRGDLKIGAAGPAEDAPTVEDVPVERQGTTTYEVTTVARTRAAQRAEQSLVHEYKQHLEAKGLKVSRKRYRPAGEIRSTYSDVWVEGLNALLEAKSSDGRDAVRQAIGQLYDYRRFHEVPPILAVLFPYRPEADRVALLNSAGIQAVWRTRDGFRDTAQGALT